MCSGMEHRDPWHNLKRLLDHMPEVVSSILYIGMGWLCVLAFVPIFHALPRAGFDWLLAGGIIYTIGGVIYALKVPLFDSRHKNFGSTKFFISLLCSEVPATLLSGISLLHRFRSEA